ncbi:MAG: hypothetical protein V1800_08875 [Candidatus Latescibacterota bacterium]
MGKSLSIIVLILTIGAPKISESAFEFREVGAASAGLGGCGVGWMHGAEGLWWNPALVGQGARTALSLSWVRPFSMEALSTETVSFVLPTPRIGFGWGLGFQSYGFSLYRETTASLAGGRQITSALYAGLAIRQTRLSIRDFGDDRGLFVDAGLLAAVSETLHWGISLHNLSGSRIRGESSSQSLATGIAYRPTTSLTLCADARKTLRFPLQIGAGAQIRLLPHFYLRTGMGNAPARFSIGGECQLRSAKLSYAAVNHFTLGFSHQVSLDWEIGNEPSP